MWSIQSRGTLASLSICETLWPSYSTMFAKHWHGCQDLGNLFYFYFLAGIYTYYWYIPSLHYHSTPRLPGLVWPFRGNHLCSTMSTLSTEHDIFFVVKSLGGSCMSVAICLEKKNHSPARPCIDPVAVSVRFQVVILIHWYPKIIWIAGCGSKW